MDWDDFRIFHSVVSHGGFSAGARAAGMSDHAARRRLRELELACGFSLFKRSVAGLSPSPAGFRLADQVRIMAACDEARPSPLDGGASTIDLVRVAAGERFPVRLILSVLASRAIGGGRPRVQFSSFREGSVPEDQTVDLLVQTGAAPAGECRARDAGKLSVGLFAHKTYLAAHGAPRKAEDLSKFALIGPESVALAVATFRPLGLGIGPSDFSFKTDSLVGGVNAIRAGLGIGFAYEALTRDDPDIVPVVPELRVEVPAWTLALDGEAASSAVRDVETAIHQRLAESTTISSAASKADHKTDLGVRPIGGKGHGMERSADRLGGSATARS